MSVMYVPHDQPADWVSLFSEPGDGGYTRIETASAGEKLRLPAPFDVMLDVASLPSPRQGDQG